MTTRRCKRGLLKIGVLLKAGIWRLSLVGHVTRLEMGTPYPGTKVFSGGMPYHGTDKHECVPETDLNQHVKNEFRRDRTWALHRKLQELVLGAVTAGYRRGLGAKP